MVNCTSESLFRMSRRAVLRLLGLGAAAAAFPGLARAEEEAFTSEQAAFGYNNFYEFGFDKFSPASRAAGFKTSPWTLRVGGLARRTEDFALENLRALLEEREFVCDMRCVEGWSMRIPWAGFPLAALLELVQPLPEARFVALESCADPQWMPEVKRGSFPFPYLEGLRLDEAMHPLAFMATGAYGKPLPPQNGAPLRLVLPWKYGFKWLKSITKITLCPEQPPTTWSRHIPEEYGFYANVNPAVPHPRWPQDTETFFGPGGLNDRKTRPTRLFNGYDQVAPLYADMDLKTHY
ncbi:MAG: protein-methionine-sulfoxide reductase catalytic subunit MsrP [Deltaproteobacteria bacterium]|jgi:sulfoxide reductase catalytic subunit YedY|nr:protein-methionine-sulfoxide reductase catalytic subunit MsrP [Deltaproteobacteria bacterium]